MTLSLPSLLQAVAIPGLALMMAVAPMASAEKPASAPLSTIVLINPNSSDTATQDMAALAEREAQGKARVVGVSNTSAPRLLTTPEDMVAASQGVVELGRQAAEDPSTGAIIVSAFSDPGLDQLREAVDIPVFGIGEEVFHEAARDGRPFGIATITPDPALIESFAAKAEALGYQDQYRGTRVTPGDPVALLDSPQALDTALADAIEASVDEDGAEAVIMGGGPLSDAAIRLQDSTEVPLVIAVSAAARAAVAALGRD